MSASANDWNCTEQEMGRTKAQTPGKECVLCLLGQYHARYFLHSAICSFAFSMRALFKPIPDSGILFSMILYVRGVSLWMNGQKSGVAERAKWLIWGYCYLMKLAKYKGDSEDDILY
jgi:hypothetical protein